MTIILINMSYLKKEKLNNVKQVIYKLENVA